MKLAICVKENAALDSVVDPRFGRAGGFLLVDTETNEQRFVSNQQNLNAAQGAGIQAAQHVIEAGATAVATGHCGPKAFHVLSAGGVQIYLDASGKAGDVLDAVKAGTMTPAAQADVEGHWV